MFQKNKTNIAVGLAVAAVFAATAASAATVDVTYQESGVFGTPNLSQIVEISSPGHDGTVRAGPFRLMGDDGYGDFLAFCIDLNNYMSSGNTYKISSSSVYGAGVDDYIDRLFTSAYAGLDTAIEGAAFQVALWEIITDGGVAYDLAGGLFTASNNFDVIGQANTYLAGLASAATGGYKLGFLSSSVSQDLVTVSPVPLPAAAGMLGLGLAGLFGFGRRKKA